MADRDPKSEGRDRERAPQAKPDVEAGQPPAGSDEMATRLEEETGKAERYLANWQRSQADFTNFKRRSEQERTELIRSANAALILKLLPVIDDLERALDNQPAQVDPSWAEGVALIYRKLMSVLEGHGVSVIPAVGEDFNPHVHEAVTHGEGPEGKVIREFQRGYKQYDRVLRPSMVMVGREPIPPVTEE